MSILSVSDSIVARRFGAVKVITLSISNCVLTLSVSYGKIVIELLMLTLDFYCLNPLLPSLNKYRV